MGILDAINERNGAAQGQMAQDEQASQQQVAEEAAGPDARQGAMEGRQRFSQAYGATPESADIMEEPAGDEEQAMHTQLEQQMIELVHSQNEGATEALVKAVMSAEDPIQGIGLLAADIVQELQSQTPGVTQDVLASIGTRTVEEITELVELSNPRIDLTEDQMGEALAIGMQQYNTNNPDSVDDDEVREFLANG